MKKLALIFCFALFATTVFSQQFLWSTLKDSTTKFVPIEDVTEKVLEFFDHYKYYYDGSGYTKEGFLKSFESSEAFKNANISLWQEIKKKIHEINSLTVIAFKSNSGTGSSVIVMCITKENVEMVTFSNEVSRGLLSASEYEREKFIKWFQTLLE